MSTMATSTSDIASPNRSLDQPIDDEASGSTRPKKKFRSLVWNDFEKTKNEQGNDIAICNHCKEKFTASSGTSNLKNHINRCKARKVGLSQQGATTKKDEGTPSSRTFVLHYLDSKSELDNYLDEPLFWVEGLNLLDWWKLNSPKYPTLSRIARDILAIPVSSVPSESALSTGGRVLNDHRASLSPEKVEALICTQSWLPPLSDSSTSWSTNEPTEADFDENDDQDKLDCALL